MINFIFIRVVFYNFGEKMVSCLMKKVYLAFVTLLAISLTSIPLALITNCRLLHDITLCEPIHLWHFYIWITVPFSSLGIIITINLIFKLIINFTNKFK